MTYEQMAREHDWFDQSTLPAIPAHWEDASWHNDACPSFMVEANPNLVVHIYIDAAEAADREMPEGPRYSVHVDDINGFDVVLNSDDWDAVLAKVAELEGTGNANA